MTPECRSGGTSPRGSVAIWAPTACASIRRSRASGSGRNKPRPHPRPCRAHRSVFAPCRSRVMDRLQYVIAFTHDLERMKSFYRDAMGFEVSADFPAFVSFATGGACLALVAVEPTQKLEFELCFHSADVDADTTRLRLRGVNFLGETKTFEFGRVAHARDPEGNLLSLLNPASPVPPGRGATMTAAVLNCRDLASTRDWYRDRLGLPVLFDSPWWIELEAGETRVALHPLVDQGVLETHHASPVTIGFASGDLDEWVEELHLRGVAFSNEITDRGYGRFAEVEDPDGNTLVLRDSPGPPSLEEKLAEEYETGDEPRQVAIRKAVNKNSKAVSRLAVRPDYRSERRTEAEPSPDLTRKKPIKSSDPERIRTRPAVGHQKQATARSLGTQTRAAATASRSKPVKRAASRGAAKSKSTGRAGK